MLAMLGCKQNSVGNFFLVKMHNYDLKYGYS